MIDKWKLCKHCNKPFVWRQRGYKWIPARPDGSVHNCTPKKSTIRNPKRQPHEKLYHTPLHCDYEDQILRIEKFNEQQAYTIPVH